MAPAPRPAPDPVAPAAPLPATEHHPHARAVLTPALPPHGQASHAYLFHGPPGAGKRQVARELAAALLGEGAPDPAGVAARVQRHAHPDLTWIVPGGAAEMLVSDVEEAVIAGATRTPFEALRRVFVLERADALNDQAANRLLKTLEEPPAFVHLILLTDRPGELLATIASRCQPVRFDAPSAEQIAAGLVARGVPADRAQACARLALGDGERALALAVGEGPALRASAEALARATLAGDLSQRPWLTLLARAQRHGEQATAELEAVVAEQGQLLSTREHRRHQREGAERVRRAARRGATAALDQGLALAGLWLRDVACVVEGAAEVVHATDRLSELGADASGRDPHRLRAGVELVDDTRRRLALNVNEELACEALAYRLARELARSSVAGARQQG